MDLEKRLLTIDNIYGIYDEFTATLDLACQKTCAHCCTSHVTLTTLEGYRLLGRLLLTLKANLRNAIQTKLDPDRFRANITPEWNRSFISSAKLNSSFFKTLHVFNML